MRAVTVQCIRYCIEQYLWLITSDLIQCTQGLGHITYKEKLLLKIPKRLHRNRSTVSQRRFLEDKLIN